MRRAVRTVAVWSGLVVAGDAISNSLRLKLDVIDHLAAAGAPLRAVGLALWTDGCDDRVTAYPDCAAALRSGIVANADLHVFEHSMHCALSDLALLVPPERLIAVYHNVTPEHLIDDVAVAAAVRRSLERRETIAHASRILCDSAFNASDLERLGFADERLVVLPLPPAIEVDAAVRTGPLTVLHVGRIVRAKGILDLRLAAAQLRAAGATFRLVLAGNAQLSDAALMCDLEADPAVEVVRSPDDATLGRLYAAADIVALPSYHEGYCVPALEALLAGCQVVSSDAGNLPELVAPLGQCVPVGDVDTLAAALRAALDAALVVRADRRAPVPGVSGPISADERRLRLAELREETSRSTYRRRFGAHLDEALAWTA